MSIEDDVKRGGGRRTKTNAERKAEKNKRAPHLRGFFIRHEHIRVREKQREEEDLAAGGQQQHLCLIIHQF